MIERATGRFVPSLLVDAGDFRRLWIGQTISVFGDQITQLGLPLVAVLTLGADAGQMGTLTAVGPCRTSCSRSPPACGSTASGRAGG